MSSSGSFHRPATFPRQSGELADLMEELRKASVDVTWVGELQTWPNKDDFDRVVPLLVAHLGQNYSDDARWTIANALARKSPAVAEAWPELIRLFAEVRETARLPLANPKPAIARQAIANALTFAFRPQHFDELKAIISNPDYGNERFILVGALRRLRKQEPVRDYLRSLLDEPQIAPELKTWGIAPDD